MAKGRTELEKEVDEKVDEFITYLKQKKCVRVHDCRIFSSIPPNKAHYIYDYRHAVHGETYTLVRVRMRIAVPTARMT